MNDDLAASSGSSLASLQQFKVKLCRAGMLGLPRVQFWQSEDAGPVGRPRSDGDNWPFSDLVDASSLCSLIFVPSVVRSRTPRPVPLAPDVSANSSKNLDTHRPWAIPALCSCRNTDLVGTARHRIRHDAVDSDGPEHQRENSEARGEVGKYPLRLHGGVDPQRLSVGRDHRAVECALRKSAGAVSLQGRCNGSA